MYEALAGSEYLPDWVAGISIGAINAAIIAGNAPDDRVKRLRSFWDGITAPTALWPTATDGWLGAWQQKVAAQSALALGQPGVFSPLALADWSSLKEPVSYYDTAAMLRTSQSYPCGPYRYTNREHRVVTKGTGPSSVHLIADLALNLSEVAYDYLAR